MTAKLYTKDGTFVREAEIPSFNPPADVVAWGERLFVKGTSAIAVDEHGGLTVIYTEGFLYELPVRTR